MPRAGYAEWDEEDLADWVDERPARRLKRRRPSWLRVALMSVGSIAGLAYLALQLEPSGRPAERSKEVPSSVLVTPAPAWKPVSASPAPYALAGASAPIAMEARQHTNGAREDTLVLGRFGDFRYAQVSLMQGAPETAGSFYIDIVRRAARAGLAVAHQGLGRTVSTKFGSLEAAPLTLAANGEQACQAFRFADADADFSFQGWLCGSSAPDDAQLACFIDGITPAAAASPPLKALFVRAERSRSEACGPAARTASVAVKPPARP
ncbi:hypothetical protein VB618_10500 [Microvirga sp. CF3062]|uniref:hypothetical protein n=1 Tax=Microvirga sp. CF3062 TaxID=3110182 RepID=UPI002E7A09EA|nr:hypothetical protein [Microvirga sp. CF3062]MEE1656630.1 hypothetical protein [Microvirga sp. CF3062]